MFIGKLRTVIPVYGDIVQSKPLVSTREFGRWMETNFADTCPEFYLAATHIKNEEGFPKHPGAYLNGFFRKHPVINIQVTQRSFAIDSHFVLECVKEGIVSLKDANKLAGGESTSYNFIKFYTLDQIEIALTPLIQYFNPPGLDLPILKYTQTTFIPCPVKQQWFYDTQIENRAPSKRLFSVGYRQDQKPRKRVSTLNEGIARVFTSGTRIDINLHKANWDGRNWEYVIVSGSRYQILVSQGNKDYHTAKVRKDGTFRYEDKAHCLMIPAGQYPVEFITETGEYQIDLKNQIMGV